jgi:hypothetical protein
MTQTMNARRVEPAVAAVLGGVAVSLAVAAALHLAGRVQGRGAPFDADDAGVAEAVIGAVLLGCAVAMVRLPRRARAIGLAGTGFAVAGFLIGLTMTARGGHWPDIAYHLTVLPILIGSLAVLVRAGSGGTGYSMPSRDRGSTSSRSS